MTLVFRISGETPFCTEIRAQSVAEAAPTAVGVGSFVLPFALSGLVIIARKVQKPLSWSLKSAAREGIAISGLPANITFIFF
jgi:hypothetical protein